MVTTYESDLPKARALELCSSHLRGSWNEITEDNIEVTMIQGGFVNRIFLCHNKISNDRVLIRLYGGRMEVGNLKDRRHVGLEGEVLIFHLMDKCGVGPKLLGVFDGGRIEEFIERADTLSDEDCVNNDIMGAFARKLAIMHSQDIPLSRKPKEMLTTIRSHFCDCWDQYKKIIRAWNFPEQSTEEHKKDVDFVLNYDFNHLVDWYEKSLATIKTRIVFSHNDPNRANCLVNHDKCGDDKLTFLDFEFSGYNYRGCDIGVHFISRMIDNVNIAKGKKKESLAKQPPYPSEEERRFFVKTYLEEAKKFYNPVDEVIDNENHLLLEAEFYGGLYHLYFTSFPLSIAKDPEKLAKRIEMERKSPPQSVHPGVSISKIIREYEQRMTNVIHLQSSPQDSSKGGSRNIS